LKASGTREKSHLPTVAAAAMALLATSPGARASDSEQNSIPPVVASKRQNEDEHTPALVLTPPSDSGILIAGHSSHSSHSSHYSSSGGGDYVPPAPDYTPPAPPATTTPTYTPPAPNPPPEPPPPQATQLNSVVLNKLAQLPSLWPKQVKLIQRFGFTEIKDGVAVGVVGAPAGTVVDLIAVKGTKLVVSYLGNKAEIDAAITDIGDRVDANAIISAPLPSSPPATTVPATTSPSGTNSPPQTMSPPSHSTSVEAT
jgi:hypothetical protein